MDEPREGSDEKKDIYTKIYNALVKLRAEFQRGYRTTLQIINNSNQIIYNNNQIIENNLQIINNNDQIIANNNQIITINNQISAGYRTIRDNNQRLDSLKKMNPDLEKHISSLN